MWVIDRICEWLTHIIRITPYPCLESVYVTLRVWVYVCGSGKGRLDYRNTQKFLTLPDTPNHSLPASHLKGFKSFQHIISCGNVSVCVAVVFVYVGEKEGSIIKDKNTCFMIMERLLCVSTTHIFMTLPLTDWVEIGAHANRCTDMHLHNHIQAVTLYVPCLFGLSVLIVIL